MDQGVAVTLFHHLKQGDDGSGLVLTKHGPDIGKGGTEATMVGQGTT